MKRITGENTRQTTLEEYGFTFTKKTEEEE